MNQPITLTTITPADRKLVTLPTPGPPLVFVVLALAWIALLPTIKAVSPPPDGGYPLGNTAEGTQALNNLTTGRHNTANGFQALFNDTTGTYNTATGHGALGGNTAGGLNTADGFQALALNTSNGNTATGFEALTSNTTGAYNTANGQKALLGNTSASFNTANGAFALNDNATGADNTAIGYTALLSNTTGTNNIALGFAAGLNLTTGSNNIDIGNEGVAAEANTIRIGTVGAQTKTFLAGIDGATVSGGVAVFVNSAGQLGTLSSSARFKESIKPMNKASEAILALKPVCFRYKHQIDPAGTSQFGLVAEDVEKVNPDLVVRDKEGKPYSVRYEQVNAMLLNEFLKEHRRVQEYGSTITELKSNAARQEATIARQQKQIEALSAGLQRVSAQLEASKPTPQVADSNY